MKNIPFALTRSPNARYANDPSYPLIMQDAFQVFECEVDGSFRMNPDVQPIPPLSKVTGA
jgi:hypothetical protein